MGIVDWTQRFGYGRGLAQDHIAVLPRVSRLPHCLLAF